MTIRRAVNIHAMNQGLNDFQACANNAPAGCYQEAKDAAARLDSVFRDLFDDLRAAGFKVNKCDGFREIEALIYGMLKDANQEKSDMFAVSEGFGNSVNHGGELRARVIRQAAENHAVLTGLQP